MSYLAQQDEFVQGVMDRLAEEREAGYREACEAVKREFGCECEANPKAIAETIRDHAEDLLNKGYDKGYGRGRMNAARDALADVIKRLGVVCAWDGVAWSAENVANAIRAQFEARIAEARAEGEQKTVSYIASWLDIDGAKDKESLGTALLSKVAEARAEGEKVRRCLIGPPEAAP